MGRKKGRSTEAVRIDKDTVNAVREYANKNEILIGGFFSLAAIKELENIKRKENDSQRICKE